MHCYDTPRPLVTSDVVIFTIHDRRLHVLLTRRADGGPWALPGGTVRIDECLERSARRELEEQTGVCGMYLEQLYTFGRPDREQNDRVISVAWYALVPADRLRLREAEDVRWSALDSLPALACDHRDIVVMAHRRLVAKLDYSTIAFQFMPEDFTLSELQSVYEIILQEALDKRNFRKRVLALGGIEETDRERRNGRHRPARLYRAKHPDRVEIIR